MGIPNSHLRAPIRRVENMAGTDDGTLNYQLSCGHVVWVFAKTEEANAAHQRMLEDYEGGIRAQLVCLACREGYPTTYAMGVELPIPPPFRPEVEEL